MLTHPQFDPVIAHVAGPFSINWYGLSYMLAFAMAFGLAWLRAQKRPDWNTEMVSDLVFYGALGVMLGGRIGYVLFYQFDAFLDNPVYLFKAWEGGMSFHGGFLGVMVAMIFVARKFDKSPFSVFDFIVPCVPTGLLSGRIGNFINGELWGRVSDSGLSWMMRFPQAAGADAALAGNPELKLAVTSMPLEQIQPHVLAANPAIAQLAAQHGGLVQLLPRHPSQLYQALGEGLLLFLLLWWFSAKPRPRYAVTALFLLGYGVARFTVEFFRQPDFDQALWFGWMTKGQLLTLPMLALGVFMMVYAYQKKIYDWR